MQNISIDEKFNNLLTDISRLELYHHERVMRALFLIGIGDAVKMFYIAYTVLFCFGYIHFVPEDGFLYTLFHYRFNVNFTFIFVFCLFVISKILKHHKNLDTHQLFSVKYKWFYFRIQETNFKTQSAYDSWLKKLNNTKTKDPFSSIVFKQNKKAEK